MRFRAKGFASLLLACTFLVVAVSGVVLFVTPRGRTANWTGWDFLGLDKHEWGSLHINTCALFLLVAALHLFLNWKLFWSCIRSKAPRVSLKTEMAVAILLTGAVVGGTLYDLPPFSSLAALNNRVKDQWERTTAAAPAPHADEFTLQRLAETVGLSPDNLVSALQEEGFADARADLSLASLSASNGVVPRDIFAAVAKRFPDVAANIPAKGGRGMGRGRADASGCSSEDSECGSGTNGEPECGTGSTCEPRAKGEPSSRPGGGWGRGMGMGRGWGLGMGQGRGKGGCTDGEPARVAEESR